MTKCNVPDVYDTTVPLEIAHLRKTLQGQDLSPGPGQVSSHLRYLCTNTLTCLAFEGAIGQYDNIRSDI